MTTSIFDRRPARILSFLALWLAFVVPARMLNARTGTSPQELPIYYEGDGLLLSIEQLNEDSGKARGRLLLSGETLKYRGTFETETLFKGSFTQAGKRSNFSAREKRNGDVLLKIAGASYVLSEVSRPSKPFPAKLKAKAEPKSKKEASKRKDRTSLGPLDERLVLEPIELRDAGMDGMVALRFLKPRGWQASGGVVWTPERYKDFVHLQLRLSAEDGREMAVHPGGMYLHNEGPLFEGAQMPHPGQLSDGAVWLPPPNSTEEYVTQIVMPSQRPQARNVELLSKTSMPEVLKLMEQNFQMVIEGARQGDAQAQSMGYRSETHFDFFADKLHLAYVENGQAFEEEIYCTGNVMTMLSEFPSSPGYTTISWSVDDLRSTRAPAGMLESTRPVTEAIGLSMQMDPRWQASIIELRARINRQEIAAIAERGRIMRQANEEIWNRHQETVRSNNESQDRMNDQFIDYLRDVDQYESGDDVVTLPSFYDHAYSDGQGNYLLTNDALFNPNTDPGLNNANWNSIGRVGN